MKPEELIDCLKQCDPQAHILFYNLEGYDLQCRELESIIEFPPACEGEEATIEITIKPEGSDEGGSFDEEEQILSLSENAMTGKPSPFN